MYALFADQYIIQVNHLAFHYAINSCYVHVMRLMLRKSIAEGLRKMYKIYRLKQWFHTQNLVHQLSLRYQWHHGYNLLAQMDSIHREPDMTPMDKEDIAAQSWLIMEKEFYRGAWMCGSPWSKPTQSTTPSQRFPKWFWTIHDWVIHN